MSIQKIYDVISVFNVLLALYGMLSLINLIQSLCWCFGESEENFPQRIVELYIDAINCWGKILSIFLYILVLPVILVDILLVAPICLIRCGWNPVREAFEIIQVIVGYNLS